MKKEKLRSIQKRKLNSVKKTLTSTLLAGAILTPVSQAAAKSEPTELTIPQRIARVRDEVNNRFQQSNVTDSLPEDLSTNAPQWGNWVNWGNWGNWGNWSNWNNWGNWGNWANQWGNWGNF
jgi:hypothetical protein